MMMISWETVRENSLIISLHCAYDLHMLSYRIRVIRIEHLHLVVFATGRSAPHVLAGRRSRRAFVHRFGIVGTERIVARTAIPTAQITVEKGTRLLQERARTVGPVRCIAVVVDFFCDHFNVGCRRERMDECLDQVFRIIPNYVSPSVSLASSSDEL